jgi:hypothetical protein
MLTLNLFPRLVGMGSEVQAPVEPAGINLDLLLLRDLWAYWSHSMGSNSPCADKAGLSAASPLTL